MASTHSALFARRLAGSVSRPQALCRAQTFSRRTFATPSSSFPERVSETASSSPSSTSSSPSSSFTSTASPTTSSPKSVIIPPLPQLSKGIPLPEHLRPQDPLVTLYSFPALEPLRFAAYPASHLLLPLRKDILQRAVVHEVDCSTQGSANTKWRDEVRGSGRKIRPQKGTGRARLGDKKSPMLRGGGVAHGPKPRDFSTELNQKIYDLAMRTALSYRFSRGELVVVDSPVDIPFKLKEGVRRVDPLKEELSGHLGDLAVEIFENLGWVKGVHGNRALFVTETESPSLTIALEARPRLGRAVLADDVEVRDLLKMDRVVIERRALNQILINHQTDLIRHVGLNRDASTDPRIIHRLYPEPFSVAS